MKFFVCLFLLLAHLMIVAQSHKQKARIQAVENGLIPFVPVNGFPSWNIEDRMRYYKVPGVSIAVIKDFKIDWAKGYGLADTRKRIPVTTQTMFSAGSISKLVMAVAALQLVEQQQLLLDAPINNYLRSWKIEENDFTRKKPVTLRMLLSHTAGTTQASYFGFTPDKNPLPTITAILSGAPVAESRPVFVNSEPAKEFRYSGGGSMIAQMALMDITQQNFAALTKRMIFDPLGMQHSTFEQPLPAPYAAQAAWAYSNAPWFKGMPYVYPQQAAAGLYATPTDLAKFFIDIQQSYRGKGKLLQQATARQMLTPQALVSNGFYIEEMGIGPFLIQQAANKENKGIYFEFTGVNAGFLAYGIANLTEGYGAVIMLNSGDDVNGLGKEIRRAIAQAYNWHGFLPEVINPIAMDTATLDRYTGRFRRGADEVVTISREKNYLVERINDGPEIYCFPVAQDTIVFTDFNVKGFFAKDKDGNIQSLQTAWQDKPMPKMKADEFTPGELLRAGKFAAAKEGYANMNMNVYQLTYLAYDLMNKQPAHLDAAQAILELAATQHPNESIVYARWGDYYLKRSDTTKAKESFRQALVLDPNDAETKQKLSVLKD